MPPEPMPVPDIATSAHPQPAPALPPEPVVVAPTATPSEPEPAQSPAPPVGLIDPRRIGPASLDPVPETPIETDLEVTELPELKG
jgi:hypothetical protein